MDTTTDHFTPLALRMRGNNERALKEIQMSKETIERLRKMQESKNTLRENET